MEHHYYFLTEILGAIGFGHFAHEYQHVIHSWLIMLIMIIGALLLARGIQILPRKGQNFLEIILEGLENFMVDITGPEGRAFSLLSPLSFSIFLYQT